MLLLLIALERENVPLPINAAQSAVIPQPAMICMRAGPVFGTEPTSRHGDIEKKIILQSRQQPRTFKCVPEKTGSCERRTCTCL